MYNKLAINMYLSIITLSVDGLNAPSRQVAEWIRKQDPYIFCFPEMHLRTKDALRPKVKGWKLLFHANRKKEC